ncbi:MAG: radical SAM family heme chaperone HemW [Planctomycetota bacterium]
MQPRNEPGTPLYVHLPFCAAKCPYCDFYSVPGEDQDTAGVIETVLREAELRGPSRPRTVFVGGGTPSYHSIAELRRLFDGLDRITGFRDSAEEVTVECNPESLDRDKAAALRDLGVDRASIGFQSLDPETLALFGRVHSADQSLRAFEAARDAGLPRVSVDLIYASPGHGVERWEAELTRVLDLRPDHLSAYNLTFEEGTPFRRWLEEGRLERLPEERELALFWSTRRIAAERGYGAYEISNFALEGEVCRHNLNYWHNGPYVGLGPSAASKEGHVRRSRTRSIRAWTRAIHEAANESGEAGGWLWEEELEPSKRLGETWWLGLRLTEGVEPERARAAAGFDAEDDPCVAVARALCGEGLLVETGDRFRLTEAGLPLADHVAARFLQSEPAGE